VLRTILCVGLLGSVATIFLGPNTAVSVIAVGVFAACLAVAGFRSLSRASRRVDGILAEELGSTNDTTAPASANQEAFPDFWRKTA
jgi:hypothetical protein